MRTSAFLGFFVLLAIAVGHAAADGRPQARHQGNCRALEDVCDQMQAVGFAFYSNLYANDTLGPRLDYDQVNWRAVKQLITDDFSWEDYSAFASAGVYNNIKKFWRAFTRATEPFEQVGLAVLNWATCDPFELRGVDQYLETFARRDGCQDQGSDAAEGVTSTSIFVTEFAYECGELKIKKVAYWTSSNLFDLVRPTRNHED